MKDGLNNIFGFNPQPDLQDIDESEELKCPVCGTVITPDTKVCPHCHEILSQDVSEVDLDEANEYFEEQKKNESKLESSVSKVIICINFIALGLSILWAFVDDIFIFKDMNMYVNNDLLMYCLGMVEDLGTAVLFGSLIYAMIKRKGYTISLGNFLISHILIWNFIFIFILNALGFSIHGGIAFIFLIFWNTSSYLKELIPVKTRSFSKFGLISFLILFFINIYSLFLLL